MNNVTVCGNIGQDGEIKPLRNGEEVLSFGVADNRGKDRDAIWWNCSIFGKERIDALKKWITKGRQVTVVGTVNERKYRDKATGEPRHSLDIRVADIHVAFDDNHSEQKATPAQRPMQPISNASGFADMDDDIPF